MKYYHVIPIILLLSILSACTDSSIRSDNEFANRIDLKFKLKMTIDEVKDILEQYEENVEFYNNCTEEFEYPITNCEKGYNRITTFPLPSKNIFLGKGDAQFYFYFDRNQLLIEHMYELYYPRDH